MKKTILFASALLVITACSNSEQKVESSEGEVRSAIAAEQSEEELAEVKKLEEEEKLMASSSTSMTFDKLAHDFGKIKVDTDNKATFVVKNTGSQPLIIEDVAVSCGCTTAEKPEEPILPGKSEKISVVFHPKPGQLNEQKKTITVTANTKPKIVVLEIKAFVNE